MALSRPLKLPVSASGLIAAANTDWGSRLVMIGVGALFGAPIATEDHAVQACRAAIAMQASIHELNRRKTSDISLRVGINSGHVVVHSIGSNLIMNYDAVGKTVHLAARMEELAAPNGIMLTAATQRLAKGFIVGDLLGLGIARGGNLVAYEGQRRTRA